MRIFDPGLEVERGSDFYQKVLLPLQQRLGPDLFTTDVRAFLMDLLTRNFPDLALSQLDALTEALVVPLEVALAPVTAEITRVHRSRSIRNPDQLTEDEADDLGANFLQERERGNTAKGVIRAYFNHPQVKRVDLTHVFTTTSGLSFVPTEVQTITAEEMLLNQEGSLYYMNVSVAATSPGGQYNIEPHQITSVRGLNGAVKVTNLARFQGGLDEQTAQEFIAELPDRVGSEGMTQPSGIINALKRSFPALTRIAIVGHGDPEMKRDLLQGESLGEMLDFGYAATAIGDNEGRATTRLLYVDPITNGRPTIFTHFPGSLVVLLGQASTNLPFRAVRVRRVVNDGLLELEESVLPLGLTSIIWVLHRREVLLSKTAGLALEGTLSVPPDQVHVGGAVDVYLRGATFAPTSTVIDVLDDAKPALAGLTLSGSGTEVTLDDLVRGTHYQEGSVTQDLVRRIWPERWALEILSGPAQGVYEILDVAEGGPVTLTLYTALPVATTGARWRILDALHVNLLAPRKMRWEDDDLETTQGLDTVSSTSLVSYLDLGVEVGDTLEILGGRDKGTYQVLQITGPGNTRLQLNEPLSKTGSGVGYRIYKENTAPGLETPVVRATKVEVLSPTGQALGVSVPYGAALGGLSQGLSNSGKGVKLEVPDALLGLISNRFPGGANLSGLTLLLFIENTGTYSITFSGANPISLASAANQINAAVGQTIAAAVYDRLGIFPLGRNAVSVVGPSTTLSNAATALFGGRFRISTRSIRSASFSSTTFSSLSPSLSLDYDVVQFRDGNQIGAHPIERVTTAPNLPPLVGMYDTNSIVARIEGGFRPEADVRLELGSRSLGVVRTYYMDPVTVEFDDDARFTHTTVTGAELTFRPDPQFSTQILPAAPSGTKPKDGNCIGGDKVFNTSLDFRAKQIRKGDRLVIDYVPLFTAALPDPVPNLAGQTFIVSYGTESQQVITFVNDNPSLPLTHVSRAGVVSQLQRYFGTAVSEDPGGVLRINPEYLLVVSRDGTANTALGFSTSTETSNRALNAGTYEIDLPGNLGCTLTSNLPYAEARMQFKIVRRGSQRIGATAMSKQLGEGGLYYFDVEVVSDGTGDEFNLVNGELFDVQNHFSDGYFLATPDPSFTFSGKDSVEIILPRRVNPVGTSDDPEEATPLTGMQVQVTADAATDVRDVQQFLSSDAQRDTCASPLALALTPHLVNVTIDYIGGPTTQEVRPELETAIHALFPDEELAVDALTTRIKQLGAASVTLPIRLFALVVDRDRRIKLLSSQDRLSAGKQSAFYPNNLTLRRIRG